MTTTAEGVETQDELLLVRKLGCSLVQGYIFGKPMPAEEALKLASSTSSVAPDGFKRARETRIRTIRAAILHHGGREIAGRLKNISSGGAMVECAEELPVGADIRLDSAFGFLIDGKVVWTKGAQTGIQFREPFNLKLLQAVKPAKPQAEGHASAK